MGRAKGAVPSPSLFASYRPLMSPSPPPPPQPPSDKKRSLRRREEHSGGVDENSFNTSFSVILAEILDSPPPLSNLTRKTHGLPKNRHSPHLLKLLASHSNRGLGKLGDQLWQWLLNLLSKSFFFLSLTRLETFVLEAKNVRRHL